MPPGGVRAQAKCRPLGPEVWEDSEPGSGELAATSQDGLVGDDCLGMPPQKRGSLGAARSSVFGNQRPIECRGSWRLLFQEINLIGDIQAICPVASVMGPEEIEFAFEVGGKFPDDSLRAILTRCCNQIGKPLPSSSRGRRLKLPSPKTEHQHKAYRVVPIFPELRPYLEDATRWPARRTPT